MYRITPIEHTADKGVLVEADSYAELFVGAAEGMFASMLDLRDLPIEIVERIEVSAPDREALMVAWLQELIFRFEVENAAFFAFNIEEATDTHLVATVRGCPWPATRPRWGAAVKAATYHGLEVAPTNGGWRARVIFDV
ncbi:MAG: archease [Armatimonadetes bacterium]|nr:archease [Armatimonadota bacterium]